MKYSRLYNILVICRAYRLEELLPPHSLSSKLKLLLKSLFWVKPRASNQPIGVRLCLALQELGPIWVKLGQMLSTRRDLLPNDIAIELAKLQDQVAPFAGEQAKQIIEQALGQPIETYFTDFNLTPLASASIAQVHSAVLKQSGANVIIKVLRPNIAPLIEADLEMMYWVAEQIEKRHPDGKRLRAYEVVREYQKTITNELNLLQEAENTKRLRHNFINSDMLYIPYVYRELCHRNIMVEERIYGIPIADISQLKQQN